MASSSSADRTPKLRLIAAVAGVAIVLAAIVAVVALRPHGADAAKPARFQSADRNFSLVLPDAARAAGGARGGAPPPPRSPPPPAGVRPPTAAGAVVVAHERPALARNSRSL